MRKNFEAAQTDANNAMARGVARAMDKSATLLQSAADAGDAEAQFALSLLYGELFDRFGIAGQAGLADVADLGEVEAAAAMHNGAIVPNHQIVQPPGVRVDETWLGGEFREVAQEHAGFRDAPALDNAGMR